MEEQLTTYLGIKIRVVGKYFKGVENHFTNEPHEFEIHSIFVEDSGADITELVCHCCVTELENQILEEQY